MSWLLAFLKLFHQISSFGYFSPNFHFFGWCTESREPIGNFTKAPKYFWEDHLFNVVPSFEEKSFWPPSSVSISVFCVGSYHQFTFKFVMKNHSPVPGFEPDSTMDQVHEADDIPMCHHASIPRMPNTIAPNLWQHLLYWHAIRFSFI